MRARVHPIAVVVCVIVVGATALGQTPGLMGTPPRAESHATEVEIAPAAASDDVSETIEAPEPSEVFAAVGAAPAPQPTVEPAANSNALDPTRTAETFTNAVLNAGGGWDPTLGRMSTGDPAIDAIIVEAGNRHGVDPKLVYAVMNQESTFKKNAVSPKGACGYMQLMPDTARRFGVTNIFDPRQNIDAGTKYLRFLLDLFGNNVELALAGYNAGEYRVIREGYRVPQIRETQNYVKLITARYYSRAKRNFAVTFGKSTITETELDEVRNAALVSADDRGTESFGNAY